MQQDISSILATCRTQYMERCCNTVCYAFRKSKKLENEVSGGQQAAIYDVIDNVVSDKDNKRQGIVPRSESDLELKENLSYASLSVMNIQPYSVISIGQHQSLIEMK